MRHLKMSAKEVDIKVTKTNQIEKKICHKNKLSRSAEDLSQFSNQKYNFLYSSADNLAYFQNKNNDNHTCNNVDEKSHIDFINFLKNYDKTKNILENMENEKDNAYLRNLRKKKKPFKGLTYSLPGDKNKKKKYRFQINSADGSSISKDHHMESEEIQHDMLPTSTDGSEEEVEKELMESFTSSPNSSNKVESEDGHLCLDEFEGDILKSKINNKNPQENKTKVNSELESDCSTKPIIVDNIHFEACKALDTSLNNVVDCQTKLSIKRNFILGDNSHLSVAQSVKRRRAHQKLEDAELSMGNSELYYNCNSCCELESKSVYDYIEPGLNFVKYVPCCCNTLPQFAAKMDLEEDFMYCKAMDTIDEHIIGCKNPISCPVLYRPSPKVPYQLLCTLHKQRLQLHHCCANCGLFCLQGKFVQCNNTNNETHLFHRSCHALIDNKKCCPHCGQTNEQLLLSVRLELKTATPPTFYLKQTSCKQSVGNNRPSLTVQRNFLSSAKSFHDYLLSSENKQLPIKNVSSLPSKEQLEIILNLLNSTELEIEKYSLDLFAAVQNEDLKALIYILSQKVDPSISFPDHENQTALHVAAASGNFLITYILCQAGAMLDIRDDKLRTPLMLAVYNNHAVVVSYLVELGAAVKLRGEDGLTALHLAAKFGHLESCVAILSSSLNHYSLINIQDDGGWTPLVWGTEHSHTSIVHYLLEQGANPQLHDFECNTALHWAAYSGNRDIARMFLEYGCRLECVNINARRDNSECVTLFLDFGGYTEVTNKEGERPIDCAALSPNSHSLPFLLINLKLSQLLENTTGHRKILSKYYFTTHVIIELYNSDVSRGKERIPVQCVNEIDDSLLPQDYLYITENCETSMMFVNRTISSLLVHCICEGKCSSNSCTCCEVSLQCWYDDEGRLLPYFNYNDPPLLFECNRACCCHVAHCKNRVFQKGITIQMELFRTFCKGWGVRTLEFIPKGTYVCEYIGEIITDHEADLREDDSYLFDLDNKDIETFCIDACHFGNLARFINHQCQPNLIPVKVFVDHQDTRFPRIGFFAVRDIKAYEELGCNASNCKYSEVTIRDTLEKYKKKLQMECN